jgi:ABC-type amino acid transport substrate-binding protein
MTAMGGRASTPTGGSAGAAASGGGAGDTGGAQSLAGAGGAPTNAGAGSGGASGGQGGQGGAGAFPALRITSDTKSIEFTPALVAAEDFYPGKATVSSGGIVTLLQDSSVDLGTNAETQTLRQSVMYPNLRIIFTVTETFYRIVANREAGIETLADLAGKRIASINNTSAAYFIHKYLGTVNVTDYTVVTGGICMATPCGGSTLPALVQNGQADAIALWEPSTEIAAQALGDNAVIFQERSLYREIVNLHSTAEKLADPEKRRGIVEFVRALIKAQQLFNTDPAAVYPRIVDAIGIQQPVLEAVWHDERYGGELVPDILDVLEEEEPWVAAQTNRTPRTRAELAPLVDDSIAREALGLP